MNLNQVLQSRDADITTIINKLDEIPTFSEVINIHRNCFQKLAVARQKFRTLNTNWLTNEKGLFPYFLEIQCYKLFQDKRYPVCHDASIFHELQQLRLRILLLKPLKRSNKTSLASSLLGTQPYLRSLKS